MDILAFVFRKKSQGRVIIDVPADGLVPLAVRNVKEAMSNSVTQTQPSVESMFTQAQAKLAQGVLSKADLDALKAAALGAKALRQRLMYLHATTPSIHAGLCAAILHEPVKGAYATMDPMQQDPEYKSVHEALQDGWRVIHFPLQRAPFDDKEVDVLGYEFVLEKMEYFNVI
jgi:hypothetical protein